MFSQVSVCSQAGVLHSMLGYTPLGRHPPADIPLHSACWDTVNKQAVCIPLECILVFRSHSNSLSSYEYLIVQWLFQKLGKGGGERNKKPLTVIFFLTYFYRSGSMAPSPLPPPICYYLNMEIQTYYNCTYL